MEGDVSCYGNYGGDSVVNQQYFNQCSPGDSSSYRQPYPGSNQHFQHQQTGGSMQSYQSVPSCSPRHTYSGQITGVPPVGQSSMQQSHPHLRNSGQNPQDIANNILHMANSSYPTNHTVQVPLSQNRSAPYHIPARSSHYTYQQQQQQQQTQDSFSQMGGDYGQNQFAYPSSVPQMHSPQMHSPQMKQAQRDMGMSPVSPASGGMIASPHSQHSSHSYQSPSPCSMHSPGVGAAVRSPVPDMIAEQRRSQVHQQMNSPQRQQNCMMPTQITPQGQRIVSTVPASQQLQVAVSSPSVQQQQQFYRDSMNQPSNIHQQYTSPRSYDSTHFSPGIQTSSSHSQYSGMHTYPSASHISQTSPNQQEQHLQSSSQCVSDSVPKPSQTSAGLANPLQSLQKLCMLPERQVIDPKSVVKETCVETSQDNSCKRSNNDNLQSQQSIGAETPASSVSESEKSQKGISRVHPSKSHEIDSESKDKCQEESEMRCQPKKARLMRAVQDDLTASKAPETHLTDTGCGETGSEQPRVSDTSEPSHAPVNSGNNCCKLELAVETNVTNQQKIQDESVTSVQSDDKTVSDSACESHINKTNEEESSTCADSSQVSDKHIRSDELEQCDQANRNEVSSSQAKYESEMVHSTSDDLEMQLSETTNDNENIMEKPVQLNMVEQTEEPVVTNTLGAGNESQLVSKKDTRSTSIHKDQLQRIESSSRLRVGSTGSISDDRDTSDYEYDHIGCDDIDNDFSDIDDRCVVNDCDADVATKDGDSENEGRDSVMISSSEWTGTKLTCITNSNHGARKGRTGLPRMCLSNNRRSRGFNNGLSNDHSVSDSDFEALEVPSPMAGDMVDGPVGLENGDGTLSVLSTGPRSRQRKTPVKYKDTSFFQGDFVFIEEEEEYLQEYRPKKEAKKIIPVDVNHNARENGRLRSQNSKKKATASRAPPTNNKKKHNSALKTTVISESSYRTSPEKHVGESPSISTKEDNKPLKCDTPKSKKEDPEKDSGVENSDSDAKKKTKKNSDLTRTRAASKTDGVKVSVSTRRSTRERERKTENCDKDLNGIKKENSSVNIPELCDNKLSKNVEQSVPSVMQTRFKNDKKERTSSSVTGGDNEVDIIEIISDSDDEVIFKSHSPSKLETRKKVSSANSKVPQATKELSTNTESTGFKFSLVEDSSIPDFDNLGEISTEVKTEKAIKKVEEKTVVHKSDKQKTVGKTLEGKETAVKKDKKNRKRKRVEDEDPDFELEPMKNSFKSMKEYDKESKKRKQYKDKWANFKGPKIVLEGEKETPEKCFVINDPFEEIGSKKAKCVTQNVTRIEISHLPSDKSVLIPSNDNLESDKWVCALCGKHSSYKFLGDLFGPYSVETMSEDLIDLGPGLINNGKKRKSEDGPSCRSGKMGRRASSASKESSEWKEVWVHESCAVYSDGVFLIGSKIYGLQEAVRIASQTVSHQLCWDMEGVIHGLSWLACLLV